MSVLRNLGKVDQVVAQNLRALERAQDDLVAGGPVSSHSLLTDRGDAGQHPAAAISADSASFANNLSVADDTVQKALETLDDLALSGTTDHSALTNRSTAGQHPASAITASTAGFGNNLSAADDTVQKALDTLDNLALSGPAGPWVLATDYGVVGDGVTDDTAAIQAMFDDLGDPVSGGRGVRGAQIIFPEGDYVISSTINVWRFSGKVMGMGLGNDPTYVSSPGRGTTFRWNGAAGVPMVRVRDSRFIVFEWIRFEGKPGFAPSAGINFRWQTGDGTGTNGYMGVEHCVFGWYPWGTDTDHDEIQLATGILFDGDNGNNDQFRIRDCLFQGCGEKPGGAAPAGIGRLSGERGVYLTNTQSVWGVIQDCAFEGLEWGVDTTANTMMLNAQFNYCGDDIRVQGTGRVDIYGWQSENAKRFADVSHTGTLRCTGGFWLVSAELMDPANRVLIDAYPSHNGQTIDMNNMEIYWPGNVKPTTMPTIPFGPNNDAPLYPNSTKDGFRISFINVRGAYSEIPVLTGPGMIYVGSGSVSKGDVIWDNPTFEGHDVFRNVLRQDGRRTLDTNVIDLPASTVSAGLNGLGVFHGGLSRTINAQTGTAYAVTSVDYAKTITRNNASASTQTWPAGAPVGTEVKVINRGVGVITHSGTGGATVAGVTSQNQWDRVTATCVATNTWVLTR